MLGNSFAKTSNQLKNSKLSKSTNEQIVPKQEQSLKKRQ
jgi:hypothetical protein